MKFRRFLRNLFVSAALLIVSFLLSLLLQEGAGAGEIIPSLFVLAVFLISMLTNGYLFGIAAALSSVLAVNFAFTFPFFEFNFTIYENAVSAIIMIAVTLLTCTLTTKIKRQEAMRAEAARETMRANLLRAISHDLRTPLTAIYGASSTIMEHYDMLSDEKRLAMLGGIREDAQWLIRMVENLLSITRIDANRVKLIKTSVVPEELVDSVLAKFKKRYPSQAVTLSLPDEFLSVSADPILIEQVLINLLENAVQHAHGMTTLSLLITAQKDKVSFSVEDDGCGVPKEHIKDIFSGSWADRTVSADSHKQGMGIGLSVCATIIRAHGGEIHAENREEGGMRFRFALDREEESCDE